MRPPTLSARRTVLYRELLRVCAGITGDDAALAVTSLRFARAEMQHANLLGAGRNSVGLAAEAICDRRRRHADALCASRANSLDGHRARALAVCIWDDGELARRAAGDGFLEDRLLWAVLSDLTRR